MIQKPLETVCKVDAKMHLMPGESYTSFALKEIYLIKIVKYLAYLF